MKTFANIKEVILLLRQHNIQPLKQQVRSGENKSKLLALYEGIASNKFSTDEEAAAALYGTDTENSTYRKLKSDLQEKLLDLVININVDQEHYTDYQKAYYECHKQWVTIRFLIGQNANMAALILAHRLMRQAEKFDFTLLSMDIASYLRVQYGLRESNDKRFMEANRLYKTYQKIYNAECLAEELYTTLVVHTVNSRSANETIHTLATEYYAQIEPEMEQYNTYKLQMYGYMIALMRFTTINDHKQALETCIEAITFFKSRPYEPRVPLQIFYYQHVLSNIQLQQFEAAKQSIKLCIQLMQEGTFNWFKFNELHLLLMLKLQRYELAESMLVKVIYHPRFEFLPDNAKELWRIYESYINYLIIIGKVEKSTNHKFRLGKFINEVPIFSKDKGGMNIAILVIKFLFLLQERKYSRVIDEVEAIEQYSYRHLRNKNTKRSHLFFKMLLQIPICEFDITRIQPRTESLLEELKTSPVQLGNQTHEIEVVPFEHLWEFALESLQKQGQLEVQKIA